MAVARLSLTSFTDGESPLRRGRALPAHVHDAAALERRDAPARARALAPRDGLEPAPAGRQRGARPRRLPVRGQPAARRRSPAPQLVVMGQAVEALTAGGIPSTRWQEAEAPARRRRWYVGGDGMLAVLLASASDVDDLVPTLVAYQIEWNKIRVRMRAAAAGRASARRTCRRRSCARELGGSAEDWERLREAWGDGVRRAAAADPRAAPVAARPDARRHATPATRA